MKYTNIKEGIFLERLNRFVARVTVDGKEEYCHVKNTGRCKELFVPNTRVFVSEIDSTKRKTRYDLISVYKGERLVNVDSQAPNQVAQEWVQAGGLCSGITKLIREKTYGDSRIDIYAETEKRKILVEVKGVTLEEDGIVRFPDAPTDRGIKHLGELEKSLAAGIEAYILFVIQMEGVRYFEPNRAGHPEFADALAKACQAGVHILAYDCKVGTDSLEISSEVPVLLR